jgi:hypothetical protein
MKEKMKVIFLDHDGVICLPEQWGSRYKKERKYRKDKKLSHDDPIDVNVRFDNFDKKCVNILNKIIEETGCEIVVTSDWRLGATLEEMGIYYENQGIIKKPIDFTHSMSYEEYEQSRVNNTFKNYNYYYKYDEVRANEIRKYLSEHPEITHWVAIDDLDMRYYSYDYTGEIIIPWGLKNFIMTRFNEGLKQTGLKDKILKYLI